VTAAVEPPLVVDWIKGPYGIRMPIFGKDPDDEEDYTIGWTNHLAPDDHIVAVDFIISGDPTLVLRSANITDTLATKKNPVSRANCAAQGWFRGGTPASNYYPTTCRIDSLKGRRLDWTFGIKILQK
jgi:hypothetical protein